MERVELGISSRLLVDVVDFHFLDSSFGYLLSTLLVSVYIPPSPRPKKDAA